MRRRTRSTARCRVARPATHRESGCSRPRTLSPINSSGRPGTIGKTRPTRPVTASATPTGRRTQRHVASNTDRTMVRVDVELSSKHRSEEIDPAAIERNMSAFVSESRSMPRGGAPCVPPNRRGRRSTARHLTKAERRDEDRRQSRGLGPRSHRDGTGRSVQCRPGPFHLEKRHGQAAAEKKARRRSGKRHSHESAPRPARPAPTGPPASAGRGSLLPDGDAPAAGRPLGGRRRSGDQRVASTPTLVAVTTHCRLE